ncbi:LysM peptidoglycan-binding domain-containing protein [Tellurirhabdus bombi]|uniref:LysM peptidoglycan-binding domain-containing protein n=1 Tax=Tellurirhabdus bombi TaxID=2907205 RepID=UPI001F211A41|nr:LysM peptidoglycan-binding domain-containing protein [Tellurirhabdus bombi]
MKHLLLVLLGGLTGLTATANAARPSSVRLDSIGVEKKDGKLFVLHRVGQGQTLYSLVRRYKTSIQNIRDANPGLNDNVRYDQLVRVPVTNLARKEEKAIEKAIKKEEKEHKKVEKDSKREEEEAKRTGKTVNPNSGIHQIEAGQTLYSLAARYGVSMDNLRKWNNLPADKVVSGQALIVSEKAWREREPSKAQLAATSKVEAAQAESPKTVSRPDSPKTERPAPPRQLAKNELPKPEREATARNDAPREETATAERRPETAPEPAAEPVEPRIIRPGDTGPLPNPGANARKISEIGIAEIIDENDNSNKYLALHRSAPIGTLVLVRNSMNNQGIWVKVIGRLPDTSINDRVIIKISARAFEKLSPADRRFRAEASYLAP